MGSLIVFAHKFECHQGDVIISFASAAEFMHGTDYLLAGRIQGEMRGPGDFSFESGAAEEFFAAAVFSNSIGMQKKSIPFHEPVVPFLKRKQIAQPDHRAPRVQALDGS